MGWATNLKAEIQYEFWRIQDKYRVVVRYFRNLKRFHKILKWYDIYDYEYTLRLFTFSLKELKKGMTHEEDVIRIPKLQAIDQLCNLIDNSLEDDDPIEIGETVEQYTARLEKISKERMNRIFEIISDKDKGLTTWWD